MMSVDIEEQRKGDSKRRCATHFWRLFPHFFLILSLISYAVLGALIFQQIESKHSSFKKSEMILSVAREVLETVQNHTGALIFQQIESKHSSFNESETILSVAQEVLETAQNCTDTSTQAFVRKMEQILENYQNKKKQNQDWNFYSSLFFSCTVFTTLGYGEMYPVTDHGKVACILYAMVGIPLMLLVISDVGDILAVLLSKAYTRLNLFCRRWRAQRLWRQSHEKALPTQVQPESDNTYTFSQDVVVHEPIHIQQAIKTKSSFRRTSLQLSNREMFDRIIVKESFKPKAELTRSCSCPQLDQNASKKVSSLFTGIGEEMDHFNVPILVILLVVFAYMVTCSQILKLWETNLEGLDGFYFIFITLTTIGFGDIVPEHPKYFMVTFLFIITGMAILSMAFKLSQSQIVSCYRRTIKCLSMGKVRIRKTYSRQ